MITGGYHGKVGNRFVLRRVNGESVLASRPEIKDRQTSPAQEEVRNKFKAASVYAKDILTIPKYRDAYKALARPGKSAYTLAVTDYFKAPWIEMIDTADYKGAPGEKIRILAFDDFMVTKVHVTVKDPNGEEVENGLCVKEPEGPAWIYTATTAQSETTGFVLEVTAYDLPGHPVVRTITIP